MNKVTLELSKKELFMLDHALRYRLTRNGARHKDLQEENSLLDNVNTAIKQLKED